MNKFLYGVLDLVKTECRNAMLLGDVNMPMLMNHAQHVESDKIREHAKENKKAKTRNYNYTQQKSGSGNRSQSNQKLYPQQPLHQLVLYPPCIGGGQRQNRLYAIQAHQDQEGSPNVVTGALQVFDLDVYELLDLGASLSFVTPYIAVQLSVSHETLSEPFSVSNLVDGPVIAR
ncbi:uncharacterized protein LOC107013423 [Solanum pennellii]|uniref:Uncharacterized protein LOC107013423 n=1 Tax=Solanum pennellii TaxID=28526 RepID=A0ABM1GBS2_SOLPN|nr:uncharacterized protein LOC107013423 [Solanum pennellii]